MRIDGIGVHIKVKDFEASKRFYEGLGFGVVFSYGPEENTKEDYRGVVFEHGGTKVEIGEGHRAVKPEVFERRMADSKISLMVQVESVAEVLARCEAMGIEPAVGPRHYYWGTLEVVVKDPDGVVLVFIAPYSKREAKRVGADETWGEARV
jgi:catechol 2,3-dioxygenase-like lactoylglutathione lyase family enzyme